MKDENPFTLLFGEVPENLIPREQLEQRIIRDFSRQKPSSKIYLLTGQRGSGKTVSMTRIAQAFAEKEDWTVVNCRPDRDLVDQISARLISEQPLVRLFQDARINLSILGAEFSVTGVSAITDKEVALDKMLEKMTKKQKNVLITIDEVTSNQYLRDFSSLYQIFIREKYRVFLLMTGLFDNIQNLQDESNLTFLHRALRIELEPLSPLLIAGKYQETFHLDQAEAKQMAELTSGYSYAFQALGYCCWEYEKTWQEALPDYQQMLFEYVYEKIWSELSFKDRQVLSAMTKAASMKTGDIRKEMNMSSSLFSIYRNRLMKKQIIYSPTFGEAAFVLPQFAEFVKMKAAWDEIDV